MQFPPGSNTITTDLTSMACFVFQQHLGADKCLQLPGGLNHWHQLQRNAGLLKQQQSQHHPRPASSNL